MEFIKDLSQKPMSKEEKYWTNWVLNTEKLLEEQERETGKQDYFQKSLYDVVKLAVERRQYEFPSSETEVVERMVRINLKMSRDSIKKIFNKDTYGIYGIGVYTILEGYMLKPETRKLSGYDTKGVHAYFHEYVIPEEVRTNGRLGICIPAVGGLFVPKKSDITDWIWYRNQIQYFELDKVI